MIEWFIPKQTINHLVKFIYPERAHIGSTKNYSAIQYNQGLHSFIQEYLSV